MSRIIRVILKSVLTIALAVFVASMVSATSNVLTTTLSCSSYSDSLTATVTYSGGLYHYAYELSYMNSYLSSPLTWFSIGNMTNLAFTNARNDKGLADPLYNGVSNNSVLWIPIPEKPLVAVGQVCNFWFDSIYAPTTVNVTIKGNRPASGNTLGMVVPEPSAIASLAIGMTGLLGFAYRKRISK